MFLKNKLNRIFFKFIIFLFIFGFLFIAVDFIVAKEIKILSNVGDIVNFRSKIGIGTSNPIHDLHIYNTSANAEIDIQSISGANNHWAIYNNASDNSLRFWKNTAGNALHLNSSSGNIGIGTTEPNAQVDIAGSINAERYSAANQLGLTGTYNMIPTSYSIVGGLLVSASGVTGATRAVNIEQSAGVTCRLNFQNGLFISTTCPSP